jgi:hypothetical protein
MISSASGGYQVEKGDDSAGGYGYELRNGKYKRTGVIRNRHI